eukprot:6998591-Lingulodinium_polyedra.AAC.1
MPPAAMPQHWETAVRLDLRLQAAEQRLESAVVVLQEHSVAAVAQRAAPKAAAPNVAPGERA